MTIKFDETKKNENIEKNTNKNNEFKIMSLLSNKMNLLKED